MIEASAIDRSIRFFLKERSGETHWVKPPDALDRSRAGGRVEMLLCEYARMWLENCSEEESMEHLRIKRR